MELWVTSGLREAVPVILDGLRRLEYRGYDSAGVAVLGKDKNLDVRRASGKLCNLGRRGAVTGRWRDRTELAIRDGRRTAARLKENAHPHRDCKGEIVVVHNGIVENYLSLRRDIDCGWGASSSPKTDTE